MSQSLYCNQCRIRLTPRLAIVSGKDPAVAEPKPEDQLTLIDSGVAFKSWKPVPWIYNAAEHGLGFTPQFWLNPDDLAETVRDRDKSNSLSGCCGPTGLNGPNQMCRRCKSPVGTLQNDCITPRVFISNPETTTWRDSDAYYWDYS